MRSIASAVADTLRLMPSEEAENSEQASIHRPREASRRRGSGTNRVGRSANRHAQPGSPPAGFVICAVLHGRVGHLDGPPDLRLRARRHRGRSHDRPGPVAAVHRARSLPRRRGRPSRPSACSHRRDGRAGRQHGSGRPRNGMDGTGLGRRHVGAADSVEHHPHPTDAGSAVPRRCPDAGGTHGGERDERVDLRRRLPHRPGAGRRTGCAGWDRAGGRRIRGPLRPRPRPRRPPAPTTGPRAVLERTGGCAPLCLALTRRVPPTNCRPT